MVVRDKVNLKDAFAMAFTDHWQFQRNWKSTTSNIKSIMEILGESTPIEAVANEKAIQKLVKQLKAQGNSPATINRKLSTLQTLFRLAYGEWGTLKTMPRFTKARTKEKNGRIRVLSLEEEQKLIQVLTDMGQLEMAHLVQVLVDTGMRLGEALKMTLEDIDFPNNAIRIWENKTDKPRSVPMTRMVQGVISKVAKGRAEGKLWTLGHNQVEYTWRKARAAMGLSQDKGFVIHALRHTCASRLVQRGVSLYVVKELLGHSSIQVTERYAHLNTAALQEAVNLLERHESVPPSWHS